jgi:O-antigen/teichoic acid export membrane protein
MIARSGVSGLQSHSEKLLMTLVRDATAARTHRLKLALFTSLAGKGVSTVVQLVALPLAIGALGQERFGVYAMLAALLNWMSIASVTITPGLTVQLVKANVEMDHARERKVLGSSLIFSAGLACLLCLGIQFGIHVVGLERLFGATYFAFADELQSGVVVLAVLLALNVALSVADGAQAGYQNQYIHNVFLSIGNVVTILAIAILVRARPTISHMIIAVYAAPIAARALSLVWLLWSRKYLTAGLMQIDLPTLRLIAGTGSSFLLTNVASFCYQSFSVYWVGRNLGPVAAAQASVFIIVLGVSGSLLTMFTQPLWPAIQDATVRNDTAWVHRAYTRISKHLMAGFGIAAVIIALAGNYITHIWIKSAIAPAGATQILLGLYLLLLAWEHLNYSFLIGLGRYWFASLSYLSGALIMMLNSLWLVALFGVAGMLAAMCSGPLLVTAWIYPIKLKRLFVVSKATEITN